MAILELKNIVFQKDEKKIIDGVSLSIEEGMVYAVVGPNGAGKSTLANIIMGLEGYKDIQGDILFDNESIVNLSVTDRAKKGITLSWQEPSRFEGLKVKTYLKFSGKNDINNALKMVGLDPQEYLERSVDSTLSGGERKRIEIASIIAMKPRLVILDEPDSGIDIEAINKIFETIKYLKESGTTVILITHSLDVLKKAEYAFILCNGKIIDKGKAGEVGNYFIERCMSCRHKNIPDEEKIK
ncbi:MAG: ABC transporter ATP-binding protein [Candidatus Nanoarchaeia archaeon]|nr:ABC transporter ATP-binding protein [Candidatus Nanoarchaeia archaeon]